MPTSQIRSERTASLATILLFFPDGDAEASDLPSREKLKEPTLPECPFSSRSTAPDTASRNWMFPFSKPTAIILSSGDREAE